ncbi:MAG TPA: M14 family zinc carboxypeptidase [Pirellulales bacterium]|nr:M14 family zinc carboxypeptidase [Pirellulales bacterium]
MHCLTFRAAVGVALLHGAVSACTAQVSWEPLGRSVENRAIEFVQLGQGECDVLLVGGMAGDDAQAVGLAERLAAHLVRFPSWLAGIKLTIVRDPNPDGRFRRTAANAHGVEIDRNFHTQRWRKVSENNRWISGREPESEPETRLLAELLADLKPQRLIVLSSGQQASLGSCGPAESWSRRVGAEWRAAPQPIDPALAPGSLAVLAGHDLGIATIVLRLPAGREVERAWSDDKRAMLAAVGAGSNHGVAPPSTAAEFPPAAVSDTSKKDARPKILTYEELAGGTALVPVIGRRDVAPLAAPAPVASVAAAPPSPTAPLPYPVPGIQSEHPAATSTAQTPAVIQVRLERLPAIDHARPALRPKQQEPIPFYPDTGM